MGNALKQLRADLLDALDGVTEEVTAHPNPVLGVLADELSVDQLLRQLLEGGSGSGHHGHEGRKGVVGGSKPGGRVQAHDARPIALMLGGGRGSSAPAIAYLDSLQSEDILELTKEVAKMPQLDRLGLPDEIDALELRASRGEAVTADDFRKASDAAKGRLAVHPSPIRPFQVSNFWEYSPLVSRLGEEDANKLLDAIEDVPAGAQRRHVLAAVAHFGPGSASQRAAGMASAAEFLAPIDKTMFSESFEPAKTAMVDTWTFTSGTPGSVTMQAAAARVGPNAGQSLYIHGNGYGMAIPSKGNPIVEGHLKRIHAETQVFYAKKKVTELTVYRGITKKSATHQPLESWTLDEKTARRFDGGAVMKAKVPVSAVLWSWESAKGLWPPEKELRGKKEVTVFGGALRNVEVL